LQRVALECPSGSLDGEEPEVAARRELEEETGYRAGHLKWLGKYAGSSSISDEEFSICLAIDVRADGGLRREITEDIEIELIPAAPSSITPDRRSGRDRGTRIRFAGKTLQVLFAGRLQAMIMLDGLWARRSGRQKPARSRCLAEFAVYFLRFISQY
jgi:hypothetical protein